jgi:RhtB (resistance to homoserine/threonine) family protein
MNFFLSQFLTIALVHFLAVVSPGPDFAIVVKNSITYGRRVGIFTSLGIGLGIFIHVAYCILGIGLIISQSIFLFNLIKYVGAGYLLYLGISSIRAKANSGQMPVFAKSSESYSLKKAVITGFMTNGLNPKATLFFLSLFTVIVRPDTPTSYQVIYGIYMAFATALWFILVSLLFSQQKVRERFLRIGHWFERVMGGVLIALGLKLALTDLGE